MSIAGVRSNRGDTYQTLVAFKWAINFLTDSEYEWLEIDSVKYTVDDIVIGKADNSIIAIQCKKNQQHFTSWSIASLGDELTNASTFLIKYPNSIARFSSRNNFGDVAKLREHSISQPDEAAFLASLGKEQIVINSALKAKLESSHSTYDFLKRTRFDTSEDYDVMEEQIRERLSVLVSNPDSAYDAIWNKLDNLGSRVGGGTNATAVQHRLTKEDLYAALKAAGSMVSSPIEVSSIRKEFSTTSGIGRAWKRDIANERITSQTLTELLDAIDERKQAILLTGKPGSGKTCVMLNLQEELEARAKSSQDIEPLFIQASSFSDANSHSDRLAIGLADQWVEKAARLAEKAYVVVVIDSLDVLSIARDHSVLQYFLSQIERLLSIPNLTVVTACRDFDRQYDRRIAERKWDCEISCQPLNWETEVDPLLNRLGISTVSIDAVTQKLITNPRELALFVELATLKGPFNVVTSQELAQRYLVSIVQENAALGDQALQATEALAAEMLKARSLLVPRQRFQASDDILRGLLSLNVIIKTIDNKLSFGHQTLLDVLVINGTVRSGTTLNEFISTLPLVPFVRPSIRSFVTQLALGERSEFRKQVRTVLTGDTAFHIKRLVAETFAEQPPNDADWPLISVLRKDHSQVYKVIYASARLPAWHYFWLKHLVPAIESERAMNDMDAHVSSVSKWCNDDPKGVIEFWTKAISLEWMASEGVAHRLGLYFSSFESRHLSLLLPLLNQLILLPKSKIFSIAESVARFVEEGVADDKVLWNYLVEGLTDEDILKYSFENQLNCGPHAFGDKRENFLSNRMEVSTLLLDLALETLEKWSHLRASKNGATPLPYRQGFLDFTSYDDIHNSEEHKHIGSMSVLLKAVESSIIKHAVANSEWWKKNRERVCFNHEGSILYSAVLACTKNPIPNIDWIGRMLCDQKMLESKISYELGELIASSFNHLDLSIQESVNATILEIFKLEAGEEGNFYWVLHARARLIDRIPALYRSKQAQLIKDQFVQSLGVLSRVPNKRQAGGIIIAPFTYETFLTASDDGVLNLLNHYKNNSGHDYDELLGGESLVGGQLREAASRQPTRFITLLKQEWHSLPKRSLNDIMEGLTNYLAHRYGNLQPNGLWEPLEEPDATEFAKLIIDELERHPLHWQLNSVAAKAIEATARVIKNVSDAERIVFLAIGFETYVQEYPIISESAGLVAQGMNMAKGDVAEALVLLTTNMQELGSVPEILLATLRRFAKDNQHAIRAVILRHLPYLQSLNSTLGWNIFDLIMHESEGLWKETEQCLYYAHYKHFEIVGPLLGRLKNEGTGKDLETWGRISALSALNNHIDINSLVEDLKAFNNSAAWKGAATVWTNHQNFQDSRDQCLLGIEAGLKSDYSHALLVAKEVQNLFRADIALVTIPRELIQSTISTIETSAEDKHYHFYGMDNWLNATAQINPDDALAAMELYLDYGIRCGIHFFDHEKVYPQIMMRLFTEAEEREESDSGEMLKRVVSNQDKLLILNVNGISQWLADAEMRE